MFATRKELTTKATHTAMVEAMISATPENTELRIMTDE
jgi:hypothetical protein